MWCGSRLWYARPIFCLERLQRLWLRQFTQLVAQMLGNAPLRADVEAVALVAYFLWHAALASAAPVDGESVRERGAFKAGQLTRDSRRPRALQ